MHIECHQRFEFINGLKIRNELKQLLTGRLQLGPFADYFTEPSNFYLQGYPDQPGNWPAFAELMLLPLWQHQEEIYAADVGTERVVAWYIECPEEYRVVASLDTAVFDMIELHVWEYGGGEKEANEAIHFAEQIALSNVDQLRRLLADFENCSDERIAEYRSGL